MGISGHASGGAVEGVTAAMTVLSFTAVAMRLYARLCVSKNAGWDDLMISISRLFALATTITMFIQVENGMARHQHTITPTEGTRLMKAFYVSIIVYNVSLCSAKISILIQYLRIFIQKRFRIACYTLLGVVIVYCAETVFIAIFFCKPIAFFWNTTIEGGKCFNKFAVWFANAGINIGTDIMTAILPLPVLRQLELPRRQRRALMIVFALGGFTCITSILRLESLYVISRAEDVSWENPLAAIWSNVECNTAIICSCLPTLRCIFPKLLNKSQYSFTGGSRSRSRDGLNNSSIHNHNQSIGTERGRCRPIKLNKFANFMTKSSNHDNKSESSLEAFGRSLDGGARENNISRSTCIRTDAGGGMAGLGDEHEMEISRTPSTKRQLLPSGRIHVMTAIEQEVEHEPAGRMERPSDSDDGVKAKGYDAV